MFAPALIILSEKSTRQQHQQNGKKNSEFPLVSIGFQVSRNPETPETQKSTTNYSIINEHFL